MKLALVFALSLVAGCSYSGDTVDRVGDDRGEDGPLPVRRTTAVVDSCPLDQNQRDTLAASSTRAALDEVVLLCLYGRTDGSIAVQGDLPEQVRADAASLRGMGYRVTYGLGLGEGLTRPYDDETGRKLLADDARRKLLAVAASEWASAVDGLDLALPPFLSNASRGDITRLASSLRDALPGQVALNVFVPPSITAPSDVPGGDAYDLAALAPLVSRMRIMSLDLSCCGAGPGPGTEPGWMVDTARFARSQAGPGPGLDVSVPLFGTLFGREERSVTYDEAVGLASANGARLERGTLGTLWFAYDDGGVRTEVWFDDAASTRVLLRAIDPATLDGSHGVLFYGLGAEQPGFWASMRRGP